MGALPRPRKPWTGSLQQQCCLPHQELGAAPRDEDARSHADPQPAELRPAQKMLKRHPAGPPFHEDIELPGRGGGGGQQPGLLLGEHAAGRPEPRGERLHGRGNDAGSGDMRHS